MTWYIRLVRLLAPFLPRRLKLAFWRFGSWRQYDVARKRAADHILSETRAVYSDSPCTLGIIEEPSLYHRHYIRACQEMRISYRVLNLLADDWLGRFQNSACDAFLVWPGCSGTAVKESFDTRLRILEQEMGYLLFPSARECWLTEHKPRLRDWLQAHGLPHPRTWVLLDPAEALAFCRTAPLPLVVKTATGASGSGVSIVRSRRALFSLARRFFGRGVRISTFDPWDTQKGYFLAQEYLEGVEEWRMVRIGDSFFGHPKSRGANGMHSGSGRCEWRTPPHAMLDLLRRVTDTGNFRSMDVDLFVTPGGDLLVNECQTVFGCSVATTQMIVDGKEGRYLWKDGAWVFDEGGYCRNHLCNLRIEFLLKMLAQQRGSIHAAPARARTGV